MTSLPESVATETGTASPAQEPTTADRPVADDPAGSWRVAGALLLLIGAGYLLISPLLGLQVAGVLALDPTILGWLALGSGVGLGSVVTLIGCAIGLVSVVAGLGLAARIPAAWFVAVALSGLHSLSICGPAGWMALALLLKAPPRSA